MADRRPNRSTIDPIGHDPPSTIGGTGGGRAHTCPHYPKTRGTEPSVIYLGGIFGGFVLWLLWRTLDKFLLGVPSHV